MKNLKNGRLLYCAPLIFGVVLFILVTAINGYTRDIEASEKYRILCDAFSVPGMLLIMISALLYLSERGAFDAIAYGLKRLLYAVIPIGAVGDFYEYKRGKRKSETAVYTLVTGTLFMIPGVILLVVSTLIFT